MKFWDSSALVPLLLKEKQSNVVEKILKQDPSMTLWWGTTVECTSALMRRSREGALSPASLEFARRRLGDFEKDAVRVEPVEQVRERAKRLLGVHHLVASDAVQLAAALSWCGESIEGEGFICLDGQLRQAARKEGFNVSPA